MVKYLTDFIGYSIKYHKHLKYVDFQTIFAKGGKSNRRLEIENSKMNDTDEVQAKIGELMQEYITPNKDDFAVVEYSDRSSKFDFSVIRIRNVDPELIQALGIEMEA